MHAAMEEAAKRLPVMRRQLGALTLLGLPIVDNLFWSNPGPKLGGALAFLLKTGKVSSDSVYTVDLKPPIYSFVKLSDLRERLRTEHCEAYWYRGQRRRYETVYRGMIPKLQQAFPEIRGIEFVLESLIPSQYRDVTMKRPADWASARRPGPPMDYFSAPLRAILASGRHELKPLFLASVQALALDSIRLLLTEKVNMTWGGNLVAPGTNTSKALAQIISVAQHYEYGSIMVDVSRNVDVALSFATHDWASGARDAVPGAGGVVYRINQKALDRAIHDLLSGGLRSSWLQSLAILGMTDIHDVGFDLKRPKLQEGGSLFGVETAAANFVIYVFRALEAFTFEDDDLDCNTILALASLRPDDDLGLAVFDPASLKKNHPFELDELADALNRFGIESDERDRIINWRKNGIV